jgi:hypothetical protein
MLRYRVSTPVQDMELLEFENRASTYDAMQSLVPNASE